MTVAPEVSPMTWTASEVDEAFAAVIAAEWPRLTGRQSPEHASFSSGDWALGDKVVTLGDRVRWRPFPWQAWAIRHIMAKRPDGTWVHPECCLIVPRQNGKSLVLSLLVLYRLFVLGENIVFTAHQWETAKSLWKRTWNLVRSRPSLERRVVGKTCSQGRGRIELENGAQVVFTTRSKDAGRGLDRIDLEIYDEAYDLTVEDMAALSPTKMAAADPQTIYTSSAVNADSQPNGEVLSTVRDRGLAGDDSLFFAEWMAPVDAPIEEPETWRLANPSYGMIQTEKKLAAELRKFSSEVGRRNFGVEYLGWGVWPTVVDELDDVDPVVSLDGWDALANTEARSSGESCVAVECEPERSGAGRVWSIAAAVDTDAGAHVQLGFHDTATPAQVVDRLVRILERNDPVALVMDWKSAAKDLIFDRLCKAGVDVELVKSTEVSATTNGFLQAVDAGLLSHDGDPRVRAALEHAQLRDIGESGGAAWSRKGGGESSPLVALSYALWGLEKYRVEPVPKRAPARLKQVRRRRARIDF